MFHVNNKKTRLLDIVNNGIEDQKYIVFGTVCYNREYRI